MLNCFSLSVNKVSNINLNSDLQIFKLFSDVMLNYFLEIILVLVVHLT